MIVTAAPVPAQQYPNAMVPYLPPGSLPWMPTAPTNTPAPFIITAAPPTAIPTNTPVPTAAASVASDARSASSRLLRARHVAASRPRGPAPILSEAGTRTPLNPTPRTTARQQAPAAAQPQQAGQQPQAGQTTPGVAAAAPLPASGQAAPAEPSVLEKLAVRAVLAVNAARAQAGALPLARNAALDTASALHAQYDVATGQAEGNFQSRGTPLYVGKTPAARVARAAGSRGPAVDRIAEVVALGEVEPERAVQGWLDSVYHRVLVLDLAAQYAGFGQHTAGTSTTAVMDLGGKRDVANASGWFPASGATEVPTRCACDDYAEATGKPGPFGYPVTLLLGQVRPQGIRLWPGSPRAPRPGRAWPPSW